MNALPMQHSLLARRIAARLAANYGIEKTEEEVWNCILNDAGRDYMTGLMMIHDIERDSRCFDNFAQTFLETPKPGPVFEVVEPNRKLEMICVAIVAASFGFAFGLLF